MSPKSNKKYLIIDGFNVLRHGQYYQDQRDRMPDYGDEHINAAREALIDDARIFAGHDYRVLVVFDGGGNRFSEGQPTFSDRVEVIFSEYGLSADSVIEQRVHKAVEDGYEVLVVTSDATMQWTVLGDKVTRMATSSFYSEVASLKSDVKPSSEAEPGKSHMTLGDRLNPEKLKRLKDLLK
ncbi:MAG: NYN domain-containing protein [Coriobacteriales bacterium]|jgi:predicted RNA-binding protein with PIN domain|nr:NYN domain-containing protein [Coriobacteriales bacterium]